MGKTLSGNTLQYISADWPAPYHVRALTTTRTGGVSAGAYNSFNLASHVEDHAEAVSRNRLLLQTDLALPAEPLWLQQVHSNRVIDANHYNSLEADASCTFEKGIVCTVLTADCLPVFFTSRQGDCVAVAHAGWRGLLNGVISSTFDAMNINAEDCLVWLGPAIGPDVFEIGKEVWQSFMEKDAGNQTAFQQKDEDHWLCDMYQLAKNELDKSGIKQIYGGGLCTYTEEKNFYSFRRDGQTGRMASLIWLE